MAKSLYILNDYIKVINFKMNAQLEKWGLISKMASAAGCQRSHLSRVLKGQIHLTLEQANGLCDFFDLNDDESEYFLALVELARAGTPSLKARIKKKLERIKRSQEDLSRRLNQPSIGIQEKEVTYYSAWYWTAIHIIVSIPQYQSVKTIAQRLSMDESTVRFCLETLEQFGFVKKQGATWQFASQSIHLPKRSPLIGIHHSNWKSRSLLSAQNPSDDGVHYTVVQSLSKEDYTVLKHMLVETIDNFSAIASPSKEEELICFSCDLFKV